MNESFEKFWSAYPRRQGKLAAKRCWDRLNPDWEQVSVILSAIAEQRTWRQWRDGFIPLPATWLNQGRWMDEPMPRIRREVRL